MANAVIGSGMDKVIAPDVIAILWPEPDTGSVVQPEPSSLRLFQWHRSSGKPSTGRLANPPHPAPVAIAVQHGHRSPASQLLSAVRQCDGSRNHRIAEPARSYPPRAGLHLLDLWVDTFVLSYVAPRPGKSGALTPASRFRIRSMQARRRAGLRSFPRRLPSG